MMKTWKNANLFWIVVILAYMSCFVVTQGSKGLILRLGNLHSRNAEVLVYQPGLHFKIPLIDKVILLDARLQSIDVPSSRVLTEEQKSVDVDYFIKWRIKNFEFYYTSTNADLYLAKNLLTRKVNDILRAQFGDKMLVDVISNNRQDLMKIITSMANDSAKDIGAEIIDVRIKSIDYPKEVTMSVYQRMKTQREQVAKMYRANGHMRASEIQAEADKEANMIKADASLEAAIIKAKGNETAANLFNKAYAANSKFYKFWKTLNVYQNSLKDKTFFIIDDNLADFLHVD